MLVFCAVGLISGCSKKANTLDEAGTERAVGRAVAAQVQPTVNATTCNGDLTKGKGRHFTCKVTLGGKAGTLPVVVRQVDAAGTLRVTPSAAVVSDAVIARQLKASLTKQFGRSFQVDCGDGGYQVRAKGSTSTCKARDRTSRRKVVVTVVDTDGTLSFEVGAAA